MLVLDKKWGPEVSQSTILVARGVTYCVLDVIPACPSYNFKILMLRYRMMVDYVKKLAEDMWL